MKRRSFLRVTGALCAAPLVGGAKADRRYTLLWITPHGGAQPNPLNRPAMAAELAKRGFVDGINLQFAIPDPWQPGNTGQMKAALEKAVGRKPDVILVSDTHNTRVVQRLAGRVPVVFWNVADPVAVGIVSSITKPGGNTTGVTVHNLTLFPKHVQMMRELSPRARRVALLTDSTFVRDGFPVTFYRQMHEVAKSVDLEMIELDVSASAARDAFADLATLRPDFILCLGPWPSRDIPVSEWIALQARLRIPVVGFGTSRRGGAADGLLFQYGVTYEETFSLCADQIAKIFSGISAGDLAVQQLTKVELVINLRVAREMGITVPKSLLLRADRLIE